MNGFSFRTVSTEDRDAALCLHRYYAELDATFPSGFDAEAWEPLSAADTEHPHGCFILVERTAREACEPVGCGAVKTLAAGIGEIKRMWLAREVRGLGLGRELLAELERQALRMGHRVVRLDTSFHLDSAINLYLSAGYSAIPAYNDNPYAAHWFEKQVGPS